MQILVILLFEWGVVETVGMLSIPYLAAAGSHGM
jgi:hypothetical protein